MGRPSVRPYQVPAKQERPGCKFIAIGIVSSFGKKPTYRAVTPNYPSRWVSRLHCKSSRSSIRAKARSNFSGVS